MEASKRPLGFPVPPGWAVEEVKLGTAWLDGDRFCPGTLEYDAPPEVQATQQTCAESDSYLFVPVCAHDPEPEVTGNQVAALLVTLRRSSSEQQKDVGAAVGDSRAEELREALRE